MCRKVRGLFFSKSASSLDVSENRACSPPEIRKEKNNSNTVENENTSDTTMPIKSVNAYEKVVGKKPKELSIDR